MSDINFDNLPLHQKLVHMIKNDEISGSVVLRPDMPVILMGIYLSSHDINQLKARGLWQRIRWINADDNKVEIQFTEGEEVK